MKNVISILSLVVIACLAHATSPELTPDNSGQGNAYVYNSGGPQASVRIEDEAARVLYLALDVESIGSFGFVQTQTKTTDKVKCVQSILGDVPGQMSGAKYNCTILVDRK